MTRSEQVAAEGLMRDGWEIIRSGWPDFLCQRDGIVKAVEVKSGGDVLRKTQITSHQWLRQAGVTVEVITLGAKPITIRPTTEDNRLFALLEQKLATDLNGVVRLAIRALATKEGVTA